MNIRQIIDEWARASGRSKEYMDEEGRWREELIFRTHGGEHEKTVSGRIAPPKLCEIHPTADEVLIHGRCISKDEFRRFAEWAYERMCGDEDGLQPGEDRPGSDPGDAEAECGTVPEPDRGGSGSSDETS